MNVVTHKYKKVDGQQAFLVNLVDEVSGHPLISEVVDTEQEKVIEANQMAEKYSANKISHNSGHTIVNDSSLLYGG